MKKLCFWSVLVLSIMILLAGCGGGGEEKNNDNDTVTYKDGSFEAESEKDERGAYGTITLVLEKGKITSADYEEIQADGTPKGPDYPYQTSVDAQPNYETQLVEKQDPEKVEAVSGATATRNKFQEAAKAALAKASE